MDKFALSNKAKNNARVSFNKLLHKYDTILCVSNVDLASPDAPDFMIVSCGDMGPLELAKFLNEAVHDLLSFIGQTLPPTGFIQN